MDIKLFEPFPYKLPGHGILTVKFGLPINSLKLIRKELPDTESASDQEVVAIVLFLATSDQITIDEAKDVSEYDLEGFAQAFLQKWKKENTGDSATAELAKRTRKTIYNLELTSDAMLGPLKASEALNKVASGNMHAFKALPPKHWT